MTTIGPGVLLTGDIDSNEDMFIDGHVEGLVLLRGSTLTIGPHGRVHGDVRAARVCILGEVRGSISAAERIELKRSAVTQGDLSANQVVVEDGASICGSIDMGRRTIAAKLARFRSTHTA